MGTIREGERQKKWSKVMCAFFFPASLSLFVDCCAISHSEGSVMRYTILALPAHPLPDGLKTGNDSLCCAFQKGWSDGMCMDHYEHSRAVPVSWRFQSGPITLRAAFLVIEALYGIVFISCFRHESTYHYTGMLRVFAHSLSGEHIPD